MKRLILLLCFVAMRVAAQPITAGDGIQSIGTIPGSGCSYGPAVWKSSATTGLYHCSGGIYVAVPTSVSGTGTVTSVAATVPAFMTIGGSPITTAGTLAFDFASQTANKFLASPSGSSGVPSFRVIASADIPNNAANTSGTAGGLSGTALGGDVTNSGNTVTLATVNSNVGTFGSATATPSVTFDGKGRATAASAITITPAESSVTFTDITTNDASITKHGFLPKLSGSTSTFFRSDGSQAAVTGSNLSLSDVTTNDVSTSAHGFAPKLPNDSTKFLNGIGTYTVPSSSGANTALSNLASVAFNTDLQSAEATQLNLGVSNRTSDAVPQIASVTGGSAYSQATTNTTGANLRLAGGMGRRFYTIVLNTGLSTKTVTTTVDGNAVTLTAGTNFTLGTDDTQGQRNVTATNLAAAINANGTLSAGLTATASTNFVYIDKKPGVGAINIATNAAGTILTATMGTDGFINLRCSANTGAVCAQFLPGTGSSYTKFFDNGSMEVNGDGSTASAIFRAKTNGSLLFEVLFNSISFVPATGFGGGNAIFDTSGNLSMPNRDITVRHLLGGGTSPTVGGSCGTSPSIAGKDSFIKVTTGTGSPTSCQVTFGTAFSNAPVCVANAQTTTTPLNISTTTTTVTVSSTALTAGEVLHIQCGSF